VQVLEFVVLESSGAGEGYPVAHCPLPLSPLIASHRDALWTHVHAQAPAAPPNSHALFSELLSAPPKATLGKATPPGLPFPSAPCAAPNPTGQNGGHTCVMHDSCSSHSRGGVILDDCILG
jgi:hypothetical protein